LRLGSVSTTSIVLANPDLGPERQHGWDAGADAAFGSRGSLSATYYDQVADDLIQFVVLQNTPPRIGQSQNVGRVKNTGIEIEGTILVGPLGLKAQYAYARSRIKQLAPNYDGDLRVGDQTLLTPKHTAGASVTIDPFRGTSVVAGVTYVGSWNNYSDESLFRCIGGTGPCQPTNRDYIVAYPGFTKLNVAVSHQISRLIEGFILIDNLTNNRAYEATDDNPVMGRVTTAGFRLRY
jgi:outer membrane receptor protein involved in Fe transport